MGVDMKEFLRIRDGPFTEWLEDTYPGKAGKNRRNSFLKYLPGVAKLAESLEEMRSEEGFKRIKEYDVEQATRGWHSVSLRNWDMFCKEQSGETPLGTQRDIVAERDNKRNANKAAKAAKATSKTAAKPAAKSSKEPVVKTKRAREPAKKIESPKRLKEEVWKAASSEDVATLKKRHGSYA
eukprot:TRINITY_DN9675_c0_g1_i5.p1 TRINITY_DN9675_c0_g1~~TRINITY_DN9675_c0_g1_i5.p1  ORF type:complete len:181 (+),score=41.67 TRINITY_DN9675_c0_g1_i5:248-790(+)